MITETCPTCPGNRQFELLDEPEQDGRHWYVCPCCGTRKLLPEVIENA